MVATTIYMTMLWPHHRRSRMNEQKMKMVRFHQPNDLMALTQMEATCTLATMRHPTMLDGAINCMWAI